MNEFILEKFKVTYDENGDEILTKSGEMRKSNFISLRVKDRFALGDNNALYDTSINATIENYSIGICTQKSYSKLAGYHEYSPYITNDSTYAGVDKLIVGARLTGEDESIVTQGDTTIHTMKNRFNPPASGTREINSLLLGELTIRTSFTGGKAALSNILLDAPCYQESDEVLIVTYRYTYNYKETFDSISFNVNNPTLAAFTAHSLNLFNSTGNNAYISVPDRMSINSNASVAKGKDLSCKTTNNIQFALLDEYISDSLVHNAEGFFKFTSVIDVNTLNGVLINSYSFYGKNTINLDTDVNFFPTLAEVKLRNKTDTCVQNIYLKSKSSIDANSTAPIPFYDLNNVGGSLGVISLSEDFSSGDSSYEYKSGLIELHRVEITSGGATGNAKYKLSTKYLTSTLTGANWQTDGSNYIIGDAHDALNFHSTNDLNKTAQSIGYALSEMINTSMIMGLQAGEFLVFNPTTRTDFYGLWVHNYDSGADGYPFKLDSSSVAGFNATDIRGVTTAEDGTIFVACAATGLWKLSRNYGESVGSTAVARVTNSGATTDTSCHAVNFSRANGRFNSDATLYALFGSELCISVDGGQNWSMFNSGTSTPFNFSGDVNKVVGICPNYHDTDNEVAIVLATTTLPRKYDDGTPTSLVNSLDVFFWNQAVSQTNGVSEDATINYNQRNYRELGIYGSCNHLFKSYIPETSYPNHKWLYKTAIGTLGNIIYLSQGLGASPTPLFDASEAVNSEILIDDLTNNITHIIGASANRDIGAANNKGYFYDVIENVNTLNQFGHTYYLTAQQDQSVTYIGRNVILACGKTNPSGTHPRNIDETAEARGYFMSFYDPRNTSRDYYEGNPLNLWYNWTYSTGSWEIDGTGDVDKLTHSNSASLVRGLSILFADGEGSTGSPLNFQLGEFFDIYTADGVVKDSYTEFTLNGMFFFGASKEGSDFFPSTVPANPSTNVTIPLAVEYHKDDYSGDVISLAYEVDYIGQSGYDGYHDESLPLTQNFALLAPKLDSDFVIEFKIGTSIAFSVIDSPSSESYYVPHFGFTNNDANIGNSASSFVYGINLKSGASHTQKILYIYHEGTYSTVTIDDYEPHLDVWKFVRSGQNISILRNEVVLHTIAITPTTLRVMYNARGQHYNTSNSVGNPISIFNAKLTFDDYRLTSRIGNPTTPSGSWDANFGKMHIEELLLGIKKLFLDGVEASILYDAETTTPNQGEIRICRGTGELVFNPADAGKVITGSWRMIPCVNVREV